MQLFKHQSRDYKQHHFVHVQGRCNVGIDFPLISVLSLKTVLYIRVDDSFLSFTLCRMSGKTLINNVLKFKLQNRKLGGFFRISIFTEFHLQNMRHLHTTTIVKNTQTFSDRTSWSTDFITWMKKKSSFACKSARYHTTHSRLILYPIKKIILNILGHEMEFSKIQIQVKVRNTCISHLIIYIYKDYK